MRAGEWLVVVATAWPAVVASRPRLVTPAPDAMAVRTHGWSPSPDLVLALAATLEGVLDDGFPDLQLTHALRPEDVNQLEQAFTAAETAIADVEAVWFTDGPEDAATGPAREATERAYALVRTARALVRAVAAVGAESPALEALRGAIEAWRAAQPRDARGQEEGEVARISAVEVTREMTRETTRERAGTASRDVPRAARDRRNRQEGPRAEPRADREAGRDGGGAGFAAGGARRAPEP